MKRISLGDEDVVHIFDISLQSTFVCTARSRTSGDGLVMLLAHTNITNPYIWLLVSNPAMFTAYRVRFGTVEEAIRFVNNVEFNARFYEFETFHEAIKFIDKEMDRLAKEKEVCK